MRIVSRSVFFGLAFMGLLTQAAPATGSSDPLRGVFEANKTELSTVCADSSKSLCSSKKVTLKSFNCLAQKSHRKTREFLAGYDGAPCDLLVKKLTASGASTPAAAAAQGISPITKPTR